MREENESVLLSRWDEALIKIPPPYPDAVHDVNVRDVSVSELEVISAEIAPPFSELH